MVFQHYALFPHMTVRRNVAFPLEMRRVGRAETGRRVQEALGLVGLAGLGDRLAAAAFRRPAAARRLGPRGGYRPALLLMEIKRMHRELRMSVLYVTHDQDEALTMSDRITAFNAGVIERVGTPLDLYERPATRFVASFIGRRTCFPARWPRPAGDRAASMRAASMFLAPCSAPRCRGPRCRVDRRTVRSVQA